MTKEEFTKITKQFNYGCDACSLGIMVNGINVMIVNCVGDGEGTVYIHDNLFVIGGSRPLDTDLILSIGSYDDNAEDITVGLRRFDICTFLEPVMILKGTHFDISRVKGTRDFVFDVEDLKIIRKPKSDKVTSILDDDEWIDIPEANGVTS